MGTELRAHGRAACGGAELVYEGTEHDMAWRRVEALRLADNLLNHWNTLSKVSSVGRVHGFTRKGNELCLVRPCHEGLLADRLLHLDGAVMPGAQLVQVLCDMLARPVHFAFCCSAHRATWLRAPSLSVLTVFKYSTSALLPPTRAERTVWTEPVPSTSTSTLRRRRASWRMG